jgi:hypothetical protein
VTYDPTRAKKLDAVRFAADGWTSVLLGQEPFPAWRRLTGPLCPPHPTGIRCLHPSCAAIRVTLPPSMLAQEFVWLAAGVERLRKHPAAAEAFPELHAACDQLARLVDTPGDKVLVGVCDCGKVLYAAHDRTHVTCPETTCKLRWGVERSRDILREALDDKLVTAADAAHLGQYLDSDRTQDNIRKLIDLRVKSGRLMAHGEIEIEVEVDGEIELRREPTYRFGDVALVLATIPKRTRKAA